jgi:hypothetical protein
MNTLARRTVIGATAITTLVVLGLAAHLSPEFKQHATTAAIALLTLISLSGLVAALVLRHLDTRPDIPPATTGPERPPGALTTTAGTAHTGSIR